MSCRQYYHWSYSYCRNNLLPQHVTSDITVVNIVIVIDTHDYCYAFKAYIKPKLKPNLFSISLDANIVTACTTVTEKHCYCTL